MAISDRRICARTAGGWPPGQARGVWVGAAGGGGGSGGGGMSLHMVARGRALPGRAHLRRRRHGRGMGARPRRVSEPRCGRFPSPSPSFSIADAMESGCNGKRFPLRTIAVCLVTRRAIRFAAAATLIRVAPGTRRSVAASDSFCGGRQHLCRLSWCDFLHRRRRRRHGRWLSRRDAVSCTCPMRNPFSAGPAGVHAQRRPTSSPTLLSAKK